MGKRVPGGAGPKRQDQPARVFLGVALVVGVLAVAAAAGRVTGVHRHGESSRAGEVGWLFVAVPVVVTLVASFVLLRLRRQGRVSWLEPWALAGSDRATRRCVWRAVRRGDLPRSEPERALALDTARRMMGFRWARVFFALLAVLQAVNLLLVQDPAFPRGLTGLSGLLLAGLVVQQSVVLRGARALVSAGATGQQATASRRLEGEEETGC